MNTYLTFFLNNDQYAFDVSNLKEIVNVSKITRVPKTQEYVLGVTNLRGDVLPVVDLRLKLDIPKNEITNETSIIVVEIPFQDEFVKVGALVDSVDEVLALSPDKIKPLFKIENTQKTKSIKGIGQKDDGQFFVLLDAENIFTENEVINIKESINLL